MAIEAEARFSFTVEWPVGEGEVVPVELVAEPVRARDRTFAGYRGFGVILPDERHAAPGAKPLGADAPVLMTRPPPPLVEKASEATMPEAEVEMSSMRMISTKRRKEASSRADRLRVVAKSAAALPSDTSAMEAPSSNIVRLPGTAAGASRRRSG